MDTSKGLAKLVVDSVGLAQEKFQHPDYMLSFSIKKGQISNGLYTPRLNFPGGEFYIALVEGRGQIALPWTHEDTWRYFKDSPEDTNAPSPLVLYQEGNWNSVVEGVSAGEIIFTRFPENIKTYTETISGGTRTGKDKILQKMNRPYSIELKHDLDSCPLCSRSEKEGENYGDLCVLQNAFTPYPFHKIIVPNKSFYKNGGDDKKYLNNPTNLFEILRLGLAYSSKSGRDNTELYTHRGFFAGQNIKHLHFHLLSFRDDSDE